MHADDIAGTKRVSLYPCAPHSPTRSPIRGVVSDTGPSTSNAVNRTPNTASSAPTDDQALRKLEHAYVRALLKHGVSDEDIGMYRRVLYELAQRVQTAPSTWNRDVLKRFLTERTTTLTPGMCGIYGNALGILEGVLQARATPAAQVRKVRRSRSPRRDARPSRPPVHRPESHCHQSNRTAVNADGAPFERIETDVHDTPESHDTPDSSFRAGRSKNAFDELMTLDQAALEDLELATQESLFEITGLHSSFDFVDGAASKPAAGTAFAAAVDADTEHDTDIWQLPPQLDMSTDARGFVEVSWDGFVAGESLRTTIQFALAECNQHGGHGMLLDMRDASVMTQTDLEWLGSAIDRAARCGLARLAIVEPREETARLQLHRLSRNIPATRILLPDDERVDIEFFDEPLDAVRTLVG